MQIVENIALITINETILVQMVSFLIFLFIMNRLMFRPLRDVMADRDQNFQTMTSEIKKNKEQIQSLSDLIKQHEKKITQESLSIKLKFEEQAHREASQIITSVINEISEMHRKAMIDIKAKVEIAGQTMQEETRSLAVEIIEKILNRRI
jgi:F-type H+-transporting ATPase subunit b